MPANNACTRTAGFSPFFGFFRGFGFCPFRWQVSSIQPPVTRAVGRTLKGNELEKQSIKKFGVSFYSFLTSITILFGMSILGVCLSAGFSSFIGYRFSIPWYSLGTPPEPAEKILNASPFSIEVVSSSGKRYTFEPNPYLLADKLQGKWVEDNSFITNDLREPTCEFNPKYTSSPKHLNAIDYAAVAWCPEIIVNIQYAILDDGSVWRWNTNPRPSLIPTSWWLGGLIGFLVGLSLVIWKMVMNVNRKSASTAKVRPTVRARGRLDSHRQNGFFVVLGFVRFVGVSRPSSRR